MLALACSVLLDALMCEFESLDRCAAYVSVRSVLEAIHRATAAGWPPDLAEQAQSAAIATVVTTAESLDHHHASAARRRCIRMALSTAVEVAASCDIARALGLDDEALDEAMRHTGRSIALLGMFFHANACRQVELE